VKRTTLIAFIAGGIVIILLWYFLLFSPTSKDLNDTRDEVSSAESQKQELQNTIRRLKALSRNATQQAATLRTLHAAIPPTPDLGAFILAANDIATASGINFLAISPSPPAANTTGGPPTMIAVSIQVSGDFFDVLDYLNRLEDLDRLVLVDTVNISAGGDDATTGGSTSSGSSSSTSSGGAPELSVTLTGRMFTDAAPPADPNAGVDTLTPTTTTPGSTSTTPGGSTPTTPPASSSGSSS
jgi:Tfp pilus assembly protein PilO